MEVALTNCLAVTACTARTFLLYYSQAGSLLAALVTPKGLYQLTPTNKLPSVGEGTAEVLSMCKAQVHFSARQFTLTGRLLGGGACCAGGQGLGQNSKNSKKWSDLILRISRAPDKTSAKPDLAELSQVLTPPTLDTFRDIVDDLAKATWTNISVKAGIIKILIKAAEQMYLAFQGGELVASPAVCTTAIVKLKLLRTRLVGDDAEEAYNDCRMGVVLSAIEEIAEGEKPPEVAVIKTAFQTRDVPPDFDYHAQIFSESLIAATLPLRLTMKKSETRKIFDGLMERLNELPWELQGLIAIVLLRIPVPERSEEHIQYFEKYFEPLLMQHHGGQNTWKIRAVAAKALWHFLKHDAPETAKEAASVCFVKALDTESHDGVLRLLKRLPRTFLNPSIICTALLGAGTGGYYNLKTRELIGIQHELLHGTARAVASLKETMIITGGLKNAKRTFEIDIGTMEARELAMLNEPRFWHGACLVGHEIIVCGGKSYPDGKALASCEKLVADKWLPLESMTCPRESHSCAAWGTTVYAVGGLGAPEAPTTVEVLKHLVWTRLPFTLPNPILVPGIYLKSEDEMIIGGGKTESPLSDVMTLNLKTGATQPMRSLPHPSAFASDLVEMHGNLLVFLSSETREVFEFDMDADSWTTREY